MSGYSMTSPSYYYFQTPQACYHGDYGCESVTPSKYDLPPIGRNQRYGRSVVPQLPPCRKLLDYCDDHPPQHRQDGSPTPTTKRTFPVVLYDIISNSDGRDFGWITNFMFYINSVNMLIAELNQAGFMLTRAESMFKNLNDYGFMRDPNSKRRGAKHDDGSASPIYYCHSEFLFRRGHPELLRDLRRKSTMYMRRWRLGAAPGSCLLCGQGCQQQDRHLSYSSLHDHRQQHQP
ncbi:hypothetical protein EV182_002249 [Spiromyces aspiralis]|uniref:Uncharacterized protein n=1 Tax=Spiromyces aspiralis TaxID=68401 RepID=A0ACC1HZK6_9FUNG|nr:hypothetical protein EV182_002249 [Spiromyces aspiralis]